MGGVLLLLAAIVVLGPRLPPFSLVWLSLFCAVGFVVAEFADFIYNFNTTL